MTVVRREGTKLRAEGASRSRGGNKKGLGLGIFFLFVMGTLEPELDLWGLSGRIGFGLERENSVSFQRFFFFFSRACLRTFFFLVLFLPACSLHACVCVCFVCHPFLSAARMRNVISFALWFSSVSVWSGTSAIFLIVVRCLRSRSRESLFPLSAVILDGFRA